MFHCFLVKTEHRNFLRLLWFKDNDLTKEVTEYRMRVHVFGNSSSPAVTIYGLRRAAQESESECIPDVCQFVQRDFYVDDGLKSLPTVDSAITLLKATQRVLALSNLRLHKIASNSPEVMDAFPPQDHAAGLKDLDLGVDDLPMQRSLGLQWDLRDTFIFQVPDEGKPFTRRGLLSTVNSLFDPLGFVAPLIIQGKALLRELTANTIDWDTPLPQEKAGIWIRWKDSLKDLNSIQIPRMYSPVSPLDGVRRVLHVFSDASTMAIGAIVYLQVTDSNGHNWTHWICDGQGKTGAKT